MPTPIDPLVAEMVEMLDENLRESFEERAGIIAESHIERAHAEALALLNVLDRHPDVLSNVVVLCVEVDGVAHFYVADSIERAREYTEAKQTEKCGMPQPTLGCPLHEPNLRHQLRLDPLHLAHLVSGHAAAPAGCLRLRQIDEGTFIDMVRLQRLEDLATQMRHEASSHLAREPQAHLIIVADE